MRNDFVWASVLVAAVGCGQPTTPPIPTNPKVIPASSSPAPETHVTQEDVKREVDEAAKTAGAYADQERDAYHKKLSEEMAQLDAKMAKLKEDAQKLGGKAQEKWEAMRPELEAKQAVMRERLAELKKATAESWKELRTGAEKAWDALRVGFEEASREVEPAPATKPGS